MSAGFASSGQVNCVDDAFAALDAALDFLLTDDVNVRGALPERLENLTRRQRTLDAAVLRTVDAFDATAAYERDGAASSAAWMRANLRHTVGGARTMVRTARRLRELPAMEAALQAGDIAQAHVQVVTRAMEQNPARRDTIAEAEPIFAASARELDPSQLAKAVTRWTHAVDPMSALEAEKAIHDQRTLSISRTFDGAVKIDGLLGPEQGATVMTALEALSTAGYRAERAAARAGRDLCDTGPERLVPDPSDERTPGQRRADALVELSLQYLNSGEAPEIAQVRPHLSLTVPFETLAAEPGATGLEPAELEGVGAISPEAARRVACDSVIAVMGLDLNGMPLTYGRTRRTVDPRLRKVLNKRDGGCRFPGCGRPVSWCEAHHIVFWAQGGKTDPDNLLLFCEFHHHLCHEGGFTVRGSPEDGTLTIHRPDGTVVADRARGPGPLP